MTEKSINILWVDDEIDMLKAHVIFLQEKGYQVHTATNGEKAVEEVKNHPVDIILLDENMPGLSGMETLSRLKDIHPEIPVVIITKNEEEDLMDEAIGSKIDDFLLKPVNPRQILLSIKKNIDNQRLINRKTTSDYQSEFSKIGLQINESMHFNDWVEVYKKLVYWELELANARGVEMEEVLNMQKEEANNAFAKYIKKNYPGWFENDKANKPLMSPSIFQKKIFPLLEQGDKVFVIVVDNLRLDQWKLLSTVLNKQFSVEEEELFCSIIPTTTQYARNAMFAGLMPYEIEQLMPDFWINENQDENMNQFEQELLESQIARAGKKIKFNYNKVYNKKGEKYINKQFSNFMNYQLNVIVYNFIDILSHARTDVEMIKELAEDEPAYRTLTLSWFKHSYLYQFLQKLSEKENVKVVITTDHGSISVKDPIKISGDRETSTNLRYKASRRLNYNPKDVFEIKNPELVHLPRISLNHSFIFATGNDYFVYQNEYNQYANYYKNTFQHGGISMEEMLIPYVVLNPKST